ncbi:MAG: peptide ABC transporter substrate-binding protein [Gemmatimonadetes bacterium]|nr:peptide ABC transporter substrate-binding protein [Gemmatimonadota bacterium]
MPTHPGPTVTAFKRIALTLGALIVLVTILGRLAWFATPQSEDEIERVMGFQVAATQAIATARSQNVPGQSAIQASSTPAKPVATEPTVETVHRVTEWTGVRGFREAPMLEQRVDAGVLPPVEDRVPENPLVVVPPQQMGPYGGIWTRFGNGPRDVGILDDRLAYEGLVRWDAMGKDVIPNLATHWTIEDDGKRYTFHIRKGVRWSDGHVFTTADIAFWYHHYLLNTDLTPVISNDFKSASGVMTMEVIDPWTVTFTFPETKGLFLQKLASGRSQEMCAYPAHYLKHFHVDFVDPDWLEQMALAKGFDLWSKLFKEEWEWRTMETPRLWPWLMVEPPPSRPIRLERNPYYWKVDPEGRQLPYIDGMTFEIFDNETINFKAINGEIGMQSRHIDFRNYSLLLEHREKGGYRVFEWLDGSSGPTCVMPNLNHRDPLVRELIEQREFRIALSHAIDREAINEINYFGIGEPRQVSPPRSSEFYWEEFSKAYTEYDPEKANRMLDQIGLTDRDGSGYRLLRDGRPLTLYIETTNQSSRELEIVASNWREVGIQAEIKELARQLWTERKRALTFDVAVWGGAAGQIPTLDPKWFVPVDVNNWNAPAYGRWYQTQGKQGERPTPKIQEAQDLWALLERTVDLEEQKRLFRKILELNRENLWIIGMVGERPSIVVVNDTFRNVPEVAVSSWMFRTPGNTAVECYAIDPG